MIASVNVSGGRKIVHVLAKTLQTQRGRIHRAGRARLLFRTADPFGERCYENWIKTTTVELFQQFDNTA